MSIWSRLFWRSALERAIRTAAQAGLLSMAQDTVQGLRLDVLVYDWKQLAALMAGGFVLGILFSVAGNAYSRTGPSFTRSEVNPNQEANPHG